MFSVQSVHTHSEHFAQSTLVNPALYQALNSGIHLAFSVQSVHTLGKHFAQSRQAVSLRHSCVPGVQQALLFTARERQEKRVHLCSLDNVRQEYFDQDLKVQLMKERKEEYQIVQGKGSRKRFIKCVEKHSEQDFQKTTKRYRLVERRRVGPKTVFTKESQRERRRTGDERRVVRRRGDVVRREVRRRWWGGFVMKTRYDIRRKKNGASLC